MTPARLALFAEVERTVFEWGRIQSNTDWILPIGACVVILLIVRYLYRRDSQELHPLLSWLLTALRSAVFLGLLVLYLQPQWRTEREMTRNSRAVVLVDTSLSMGLTDADGPSATRAATRAQQVAKTLAESDFLRELRQTHDVTVVPFGEGLDRDRAVTLGKLVPQPLEDDEDESSSTDPNRTDANRTAPKSPGTAVPGGTSAPGSLKNAPPDWQKLLAPKGAETRLGQSLRQMIYDERNSPVSAIIVVSDGGQNAGIAPEAAIDSAREAKVPVFTVGVGSDRKPVNVRVSDLVAPARAYPGDHYTITGFLQAQGMAGRVVDVQLLLRTAGGGGKTPEPGTGQVVARQQVTLGADGEVLPVKFEQTPDKTGRQTFCFRVEAPPGGRAPADNFREADVEIVDRKNRVLLLAGGPTREYQFLRAQLYRDRSTTLEVLLQTGQAGMSQEAHKMLSDFPATREEMFAYDCVVAFDPDWQALSAPQIDLLETWVADQGGGLVVIAGPVFMGKTVGGWIRDASTAMNKIRGLYPVEFQRRFSATDTGMETAKDPWPLDFTRDGLEADYLWLGDSVTASRQAWTGFAGVYSVYPVRGPKPGASVLARLADPRPDRGSQQAVYFAEQFYGSGRVFYLGSGEMWRLRRLDEAYFEQFYTKLLRHVSQGRLLRGSSRGVLLVGQDRYLLGDTAEVRAQLTNARLEPLAVPEVALEVIGPNGTPKTVELKAASSRPGTYAGRFPVLQEGDYRLELPVPESDNERLTRRLHARLPDLERENPQRNDPLLSHIAQQTGGRYYIGLDTAVNSGAQSLVKQLKDATRTMIINAAPDPEGQRIWLERMMYVLIGLLCLEWLIRRLMKLA